MTLTTAEALEFAHEIEKLCAKHHVWFTEKKEVRPPEGVKNIQIVIDLKVNDLNS